MVARILDPGAYGLYGSAFAIMAFFLMLVESGVARSLVQFKGDVEAIASTAFSVTFLASAVAAGGVWAASGLINKFVGGEAEGAGVISTMGLQIIVVALGAIPRALLERGMRFKPIFVGRLAAALTTCVVSIGAAVVGLGVWSLVFGAIAGSLADTAVLWNAGRFRPTLSFSGADLAKVGGFSAWTLGHDCLAWVILYADVLLVAAFLDLEQVGIYRLASMMVISAFAVCFLPAERVLFTSFARVGEKWRVAALLCPLIALGALAAVPAGVVAFAFREELETWVFAEQWAGIGWVLGMVALREGLSNSVFAIDAAYKGLGRPDIIFKIRVVSSMIYLGIQVYAIRIGFHEFLVARLVGTLISLGLILAVARHFFGSCRMGQSRDRRLALVCAFAIGLLALMELKWSIPRIAVLVPIGCLVVVLLHYLRRLAASTVGAFPDFRQENASIKSRG